MRISLRCRRAGTADDTDDVFQEHTIARAVRSLIDGQACSLIAEHQCQAFTLAAVLEELVEAIDAQKFVTTAQSSPIVWAQRLWLRAQPDGPR
jgi:hypothetical protein